MIFLYFTFLILLLVLGVSFAIQGDSSSRMSEYEIYGEVGEYEWTRQSLGMSEEEYKDFINE